MAANNLTPLSNKVKFPFCNWWKMIDSESPYSQIMILTASANTAKNIAGGPQFHGRTTVLIRHDKEFKWPRKQPIKTPIIVGTQEICLDYALKYKCVDLSKIKVFILDEVDKLIAVQGYDYRIISIARELTGGCKIVFFADINEANRVNVENFAERLGILCDTEVTIQPMRFLTSM